MEIGTLCLLWLISWPLFSYVLEMYSIIASFWNLQNVLSLQMLQILLQKNAAWSRRFDREVVELRAAGKVIRSFFLHFFLFLKYQIHLYLNCQHQEKFALLKEEFIHHQSPHHFSTLLTLLGFKLNLPDNYSDCTT